MQGVDELAKALYEAFVEAAKKSANATCAKAAKFGHVRWGKVSADTKELWREVARCASNRIHARLKDAAGCPN